MGNHRPFFNPKPLKNIFYNTKTMPVYCIKLLKSGEWMRLVAVRGSF
jgi:hypothetical protein